MPIIHSLSTPRLSLVLQLTDLFFNIFLTHKQLRRHLPNLFRVHARPLNHVNTKDTNSSLVLQYATRATDFNDCSVPPQPPFHAMRLIALLCREPVQPDLHPGPPPHHHAGGHKEHQEDLTYSLAQSVSNVKVQTYRHYNHFLQCQGTDLQTL